MIGAIILAGGRGQRMQAKEPKAFLPFGGRPLVMHSLTVFKNHPAIDHIVVVTPVAYQYLFQHTALPGERRQDSTFNGFAALPPGCSTIIIHDAARPFVTKESIDRLLEAKAPATLAAPVTSTIKQADANHTVVQTLPRHTLWDIQTPQLLTRDMLEKAMTIQDTVTDDVSLAEKLGYTVTIVPNSPKNIKITYPEDLIIAEALSLCATV